MIAVLVDVFSIRSAPASKRLFLLTPQFTLIFIDFLPRIFLQFLNTYLFFSDLFGFFNESSELFLFFRIVSNFSMILQIICFLQIIPPSFPYFYIASFKSFPSSFPSSFFHIFRCVLASLYEVVLAGWMVGWSDGP